MSASISSYQSLPSITIDGQLNPPDFMDDLLQVIVDESLHLPSTFTLVIRNDYQGVGSDDTSWSHQNTIKMGTMVKIGFIPSANEKGKSDKSKKQEGEENDKYLIEGEITAIETHFSDRTQAPIIVRGYDLSHRLHRGRHNRSFQDMTDSDIVKKVIKEAGIDEGTIDESGIPHEYVFQENQTNMAFLRDRASRLGYELFMQDNQLNFRKPKKDETLNLKWLREISNFRVRVTSAEQIKEVEVRGWDYKSKQPIIANVSSEKIITDTDNKQGKDITGEFDGKPSEQKMILVDRPMFQPKEADNMAQALYDELSGQYVYADAKGEGNPNIRPGRVVELDDMGPHSGQYYVTETRHVYRDRIYTTEFSVRGLRCGDLISALSPKTRPQPGQTALVGIVTDNEDPEGLGRVKVKFPTLTEDHNSNWARVVSMGAGSSRGFDCLPEIDDEVLVTFEHGDIHRPYIVGGVWNGTDAPPNPPEDNVQDSKVRLRTIQTRVGHKIQLIEEDKGESKTGILIETTGGHKIYLNDSSGLIEIQSTGDVKIGAPGKIDLGADGDVSINAGGNMTIQATANVTVKGAMIMLN